MVNPSIKVAFLCVVFYRPLIRAKQLKNALKLKRLIFLEFLNESPFTLFWPYHSQIMINDQNLHERATGYCFTVNSCGNEIEVPIVRQKHWSFRI